MEHRGAGWASLPCPTHAFSGGSEDHLSSRDGSMENSSLFKTALDVSVSQVSQKRRDEGGREHPQIAEAPGPGCTRGNAVWKVHADMAAENQNPSELEVKVV